MGAEHSRNLDERGFFNELDQTEKSNPLSSSLNKSTSALNRGFTDKLKNVFSSNSQTKDRLKDIVVVNKGNRRSFYYSNDVKKFGQTRSKSVEFLKSTDPDSHILLNKLEKISLFTPISLNEQEKYTNTITISKDRRQILKPISILKEDDFKKIMVVIIDIIDEHNKIIVENQKIIDNRKLNIDAMTKRINENFTNQLKEYEIDSQTLNFSTWYNSTVESLKETQNLQDKSREMISEIKNEVETYMNLIQ